MSLYIDYYPLATRLVEMAIATERVNGEITKIKTWLRSRIELTPTAVDFIQNNNIIPEIVSRAGLDEDLTFAAITELSSEIIDGKYQYQIQLLISSDES